MSIRVGIFKSFAFAMMMAMLLACAGEKGAIEEQYAKMDNVVNLDNAAAVTKILSEDFTLTLKGGEAPNGTYLFDGKGYFTGKSGRNESARKMAAREFYLRHHGAAQSGDKFQTVVDDCQVSGDTATTKVTRTQTKRASSRSGHMVAQIIYTTEDTWKKEGEAWRMTTSDVKNVEFKEVK